MQDLDVWDLNKGLYPVT